MKRTAEHLGREVVVCRDLPELSRRAAGFFVQLALDAIAERGSFAVALSGGSTPRTMYGVLATEYRSRVPWSEVHCFWSDERCVPPDHPESNYRMAHEALLSRVDIPAGNIHRLRGEDPDPARAVSDYDRKLRAHFRISGDSPPRFDLMMLGLGDDGHTASLFPGTAALREARAFAAANYVEKFGAYRLTLTLPVLNAAATVQFLVSGEDKAGVFASVLGGDSRKPLPAQLVQPQEGKVVWFVDAAAAALWTERRQSADP